MPSCVKPAGDSRAVNLDAAEHLKFIRLVAESIYMRAGMFHHGQDARRAGPWPVFRGAVGVAVSPVQGVEVAGLVRRVDRHAREARLLQVVNACRQQGIQQGGRHDGMIRCQKVIDDLASCQSGNESNGKDCLKRSALFIVGSDVRATQRRQPRPGQETLP